MTYFEYAERAAGGTPCELDTVELDGLLVLENEAAEEVIVRYLASSRDATV